jgi:hypothetical protein
MNFNDGVQANATIWRVKYQSAVYQSDSTPFYESMQGQLIKLTAQSDGDRWMLIRAGEWDYVSDYVQCEIVVIDHTPGNASPFTEDDYVYAVFMGEYGPTGPTGPMVANLDGGHADTIYTNLIKIDGGGA